MVACADDPPVTGVGVSTMAETPAGCDVSVNVVVSVLP